LIFAVADDRLFSEEKLCLTFHDGDFRPDVTWNGNRSTKDAVAKILIERVEVEFKNFKDLRLFKGVAGQHSFIGNFHQQANRLREFLRPEKIGNVGLPGNLHDMVRIAYSIPRIIALVSVVSERSMNLFPTDLHGKVSGDFYISSLRIGGKAQQQVERIRKVVIAEVDSKSFRTVYSLGKNHTKDLDGFQSFKLYGEMSEYLNYPLPADVLRYYELEVCDFVDVGIHRIYLYKILNSKEISAGPTLSHIHQYYAQWRKDHGVDTEYLLR
jgi:flavin reductase (DIM6/NTAB) family NADH-FMN oxidoreductase RutF